MSLVYFVSQMAGGIAGYRLMWFLTPDEVRQLAGPTGICMTLPGHGVSTEQAMICEFVATTILVLLNCVAWDPRNAGRQDSMALKLGLAVACLSVALVCLLIFFLNGEKIILFHIKKGSVLGMQYESDSFIWACILESIMGTPLGENCICIFIYLFTLAGYALRFIGQCRSAQPESQL